MKKILLVPLAFFYAYTSYAAAPPIVGVSGLPGGLNTKAGSVNYLVEKIIPNLIADIIKYIAVIAVISTMISGLMYLTSAGKEETTKKAKNWIIWSLVGVLLSVSAWFIINLINTVSIPNS